MRIPRYVLTIKSNKNACLSPTFLLSSVAEKTISLPPCQDWQESNTRVAELPQNLSQRSPAISPRLCWVHTVPKMFRTQYWEVRFVGNRVSLDGITRSVHYKSNWILKTLRRYIAIYFTLSNPNFQFKRFFIVNLHIKIDI